MEVRPYKIGVEIETDIKGDEVCDFCGSCQICENCPICEDCRFFRNFCDSCEIAEMVEYAQERGFKNAQEINICTICEENELWRDIICERCNACEDCTYTYDLSNCPIDSYNFIVSEDLAKYLEHSYYDESCGIEFVTKTFDNLRELREFLKAFVEEIGEDRLDPYCKCGGHTNISFENWEEEEEKIYQNTWYFLDLLSYMFNEKYTYIRGSYKYFPINYWETDDKFRAIHMKHYAVEFRFPDSPRDVDSHVLLSAILLSLSMLPKKLNFDKDEKLRVKEIYEKIHMEGEDLTQRDISYLKTKFHTLMRIIKPYLEHFSKELGFDLIKAAYWRFNNPKYLDKDNEVKLNFEDFPLNSAKPYERIDQKQTTLSQFIEIEAVC